MTSVSAGLLEISDKYSTKLNDFSYVILQFSHKSLENAITILYDFEKKSG